VSKADNLPPSCADVKKSGCLNLREFCGPVQASNGTNLPEAYDCKITACFMVWCYSGGLAVRRAAAWYCVLGVKVDA
jgi:hypothetical protein